MSYKRDIQYEPTNLLNLVYPAEKTPTHLYILPLRTRADDFMDILLQQPALEGNGRSITIDLKDAIKTKINNIQQIQKESTTATTFIYPVELSGTNAIVLPIQAINSDYISVLVAQPLSAGLGRSIQIDLKDTIKSKLDLIETIQKESTTSTTYIYIYILLNYLQHQQLVYQFKQ